MSKKALNPHPMTRRTHLRHSHKRLIERKKTKISPSSHSAASVIDTEDNKRKTAAMNADFSGSKSASAVRESTPFRQPKTSITSSMKRHHKPSDIRKAKMDALLQELEAEKDEIPRNSKRFVPEKKGSFVVAGEEHLTSNLFVGNLAPSIAEEDLSNLFSQFGEKYSLYSVCA